MKLFERFKAWRLRRQETVIAKATLLGCEIEFVPENWALYNNVMLKMDPPHYRSAAPVHGGMGSVSVYGKTPYKVAKQWMKLQELT